MKVDAEPNVSSVDLLCCQYIEIWKKEWFLLATNLCGACFRIEYSFD